MIKKMSKDFSANIFPLPSAQEPEDHKLCRDEYIEKIFSTYEGEFKRMLLLKATKQHEEEDKEKKEEEEEDTKKQTKEVKIKIFEKLRNNLGRPVQALDFIFLLYEQDEKEKIENKTNSFSLKKHREAAKTAKLFDEAIKSAAFQYQIYQIIEELMVIGSIGRSSQTAVPYKLFSWSLEELKARTETENTIHFDILEYELTEEALDTIKFNVDIREAVKLFYLMNDAIDDQDFRELLVVLNDCKLAANYRKESQDVYRPEYDNLIELYFAATSGRVEARSTIGHNSKLQLDNLHDYTETVDPIMNRYKYKWCTTIKQQNILRNQKTINELKEKIVNILKSKSNADYVSECSMTLYNLQMDKYRTIYDEMLSRYDDDLEMAMNEIEVARLKTQKAKDDVIFFKEQVVMFRRRIIEVSAIVEAEEAAEKQRLLENPPPPPEKQKKKKGKGKLSPFVSKLLV